MNPVYVDIANQLELGGLGTVGTDIFGGEWGGNADYQILVLDSSFAPSELKEIYESPGFQILVRGEKRQADIDVYATAKAISDFLLQQPEQVEIDSTCYNGFEPSSNIAALGKDQNERFVYSMNFTTYRNAF